MATFVFHALGSLGDLHPQLALALELKRRGHACRFATTAYYRARIEEAGLSFFPIRPDLDPTDPRLVERLLHARSGLRELMSELVFRHLRDTYSDLAAACHEADLLVSGNNCYAPPLVHEKLGIPWASTILQPFGFFSRRAPPIPPGMYWMRHLYRLGGWVGGLTVAIARAATASWGKDVHRLREELGLRRVAHPIFEGQHSPELVLAMFSKHIFPLQADWPASTLVTGPIDFDGGGTLPAKLEAFLAEGEPPVVFTLGSAAVHAPDAFFSNSLAVVRALGCRAVFVVGSEREATAFAEPRICAVPPVPYSKLFPRARAIVHQCGAGTCSQAARSGRPMLMVPFGQDQFDNAHHLEQRGVGVTVPFQRYRHRTGLGALRKVLAEPRFTEAARELGDRVRAEDGLTVAANALEAHAHAAHRASRAS